MQTAHTSRPVHVSGRIRLSLSLVGRHGSDRDRGQADDPRVTGVHHGTVEAGQ